MTEQNPEVYETSDEPNEESEEVNFDEPQPEPEASQTKFEVKFSVEDDNPDYAAGAFTSNARSLKDNFIELYKEDPSASFRLTLERL